MFALFAFLAYDETERDLDGELGQRMSAIASSAAPELTARYLNGNPELQKVEAGKLARLADATGAHLFVLDRDFTTKLDTDPDATIGAPDYAAEIDRYEINRVWSDNVPAASEVTFEGDDGKQYKAGYAPLLEDDKTAFVLGADAPAGYFDRLDHLRASLYEWGMGLAALLLLASIAVTVLITRPVRKLAAAAERIGTGDLEAPVRVHSRDEIGLLAATMERMRTQLRERDAHMQQMLAGIAHEVRNPLAGMTLFTGILRDEVGDEQRAHVDKIARELGYLERVVHEFLDYARRPPLEPTTFPLRPLLDEVAELAGGGVTVSIEGAGEVRADRTQLRRALLNLVQNAREAGSDVRLVARRDGREIDVTDRGPEIPADVRDRIFEPFFTTREKGTGLGLAFVREIVRAHGGDVVVTCENGETRFRVTLPA